MNLVNINGQDLIYRDPLVGDIHKVYPLLNLSDAYPNTWYIFEGYVYESLGEITTSADQRQGTIFKFVDEINFIPYKDDDLKKRFSLENVMPREAYEEELKLSNDMDEIMEEYLNSYELGNNLILYTETNVTASGEIFMPELRPDDDPFEKVIKSMLRYMKIVLNEYKKTVDKPHVLDNLRSALIGATKNMSITKFLLWCKVLNLDWEIRLTDACDENKSNSIGDDIWISNHQNTWVDIKPSEIKGIFVVPLTDKDDPLKRLIKLALDKKRINTKECESKCSSAHLINNMKSALKNDQKTTMLYFMSWCELLDLIFEIKVTDPKSGIYFQTIGFDLYTNADPSDLEDLPKEEL